MVKPRSERFHAQRGWGIALVLMSVMASALGGLITGRLRTRWVGIHSDDTYFRDSAHGFLAWAFGSVLTAAALASATSTLVSMASGIGSNPALAQASHAYYVDALFRSSHPVSANPGVIETTNGEATRLFAHGLIHGTEFTSNDRARLSDLVAARTGLAQQEAQQRVDQTIAQAKQAADEVRRTAATMAFWMAAAMLAGALAASVAAIEGGHERDASPCTATA